MAQSATLEADGEISVLKKQKVAPARR